jgi:acyl-CoA thioesterase FadM
VARDAFFGEVLGSGPLYVLARLEIDFRAEIPKADRLVRAQIAVARLGRTSLTTVETIHRENGKVAAAARVVTVCWDGERRAPRPFSEAERARLTAFLAADS